MVKWGTLFAVFLMVTSLLYFFIYQKKSELNSNNNLDLDVNRPGLSFEFFSIKNYVGSELESALSVNKGSFNDARQMELTGNVKGWRKVKKVEESITSDIVLGEFSSTSFADFLKNPKLTAVYFKKNVKMMTDDFSLSSSSAKYDVEHRQISGEEWVRMENSRYEASGDQGFNFDIDKESLNIFGPVQGKVFSHE